MIFNFYIFNRRGACLYYREWNRPYNSFALDDQDEERKLVFGMLFSIKELVSRMKPPGAVDDGLHCLKTSTYTLHHLEILTGLRFVLNTDSATPDLHVTLLDIYSRLYTEYVVKSPTHDPTSPKPIDSPLFDRHLDEYVRNLTCFR